MNICKKIILSSVCVTTFLAFTPVAQASSLKRACKGIFGGALVYGGARLFAAYVLEVKDLKKVDCTVFSLLLASGGSYILHDTLRGDKKGDI